MAVKEGKESSSEWEDRTRTMVTMSRGAPFRVRHLVTDLKQYFPQIHIEPKIEKKAGVLQVNEMAELSRCSRVMYFECRSGQDVYLWMSSNIATGPSVKFQIQNVHTMSELNFSGNCLRYSRPILSFDAGFSASPHMELLKEMLCQVFRVPKKHPKSKPFFDHVINFGLTSDGRIWVRFYELPSEDGSRDPEEIGPRFVLELNRIFSGSFQGEVIYNNPSYSTPRFQRAQKRYEDALKSRARRAEKEARVIKSVELKKVKRADPVGEIFEEAVMDDAAKRLEAELEKPSRKVLRKKKAKAAGAPKAKKSKTAA